MPLYDIVSDIDAAQTDRLAMKSLGAQVDRDVRNPDSPNTPLSLIHI